MTALAQAQLIASQERLHARAFNVVRLAFPTEDEVAGIGVSISRDGERFESTNAGLPRPGRLFTACATTDETTTIFLAAVGSFEMGRWSFLFDTPGTYYLRWEIRFESRELPIRTIEQKLEVANPTSADIAFITGLAQPKLVRAMFGADVFDRQTGDAAGAINDAETRALMVIGRLLSATRHNWAADIMRVAGPRGDVHETAEILLALANRVPESSYAPYAAFYAGCCYSAASLEAAEKASRERVDQRGLQDDVAMTTYRAELLSLDSQSAKANEAFSLAAQRADDYLKPRVLYQDGFLRLVSLDLDGAERVLSAAEDAVPGEATTQEWVHEARKSVQELRAVLDEVKVGAPRVGDSETDPQEP